MKKISTVYLTALLAITLGVGGCAAPRASNAPAASSNSANTESASAPTSEANAAAVAPSDASGGAGVESHADAAAVAPADGGAATPTAADAGSWTQWRGAARDGRVSGFNVPAAWPKTLREEWKVSVGTGHATPLVAGGRIYVFSRDGEEEVLRALDARTGKEIWKSGYAVAYEMHSAARAHGKGPKSTPVLSGERLCTLGIAGVLSCHDARTGRLKWRKEFSKQFGVTAPQFGTAMSPVFEGRLLIAHVGGHNKGALTAFDAETGAVKWSYDADGPAYASPVVATFAGTRQVVTFTQKELVGVEAATGKLLWKLPSKTQYDENCNTPVVHRDLIIFSREERGVEAIRLVKKGTAIEPQEAWRNEENEVYMNTPVLHGNVLFGLSSRKKGQFFALDADTGKTLWQGEGRAGENAAILSAGRFFLALTNDATLYVFPADVRAPSAPSAQYTVAKSPTWAHPVAAGDRILVKDETTLASLSLK